MLCFFLGQQYIDLREEQEIDSTSSLLKSLTKECDNHFTNLCKIVDKFDNLFSIKFYVANWYLKKKLERK